MRKLTTKQKLVIENAAKLVKKAADIIYKYGDGNLYTNGLSEHAYSVARELRNFS